MKQLGKTLRLFLVDGTSSGIVFAEIINWSGQVVRVPRSLLGQFLERKESSRTGVYLLIGNDEEEVGRIRAYVGESDNVGERLRQHANSEDIFDWDYACVITSKDQNLTKAHGLFLESQIIDRAKVAGRVRLENIKTKIYESIPESDVSDMLYFSDQVAVLLPALGVELFAPITLTSRAIGTSNVVASSGSVGSDAIASLPKDLQSATNGPATIAVVLKDNTFGIEAQGLESNGEILVLAGSKARGENDSKINVYSQLRERLIREGKIIKTDNPRVLLFASDVLFNSPSAASAVILDRNDNGRTSWKEKTTQRSLNDWYAFQANQVHQPTVSAI